MFNRPMKAVNGNMVERREREIKDPIWIRVRFLVRGNVHYSLVKLLDESVNCTYKISLKHSPTPGNGYEPFFFFGGL
jgi:hypothetical protein